MPPACSCYLTTSLFCLESWQQVWIWGFNGVAHVTSRASTGWCSGDVDSFLLDLSHTTLFKRL